ncbi:AAA family ATPase [Streptomyces sp. NPDC048508]|uniref:helix-turn-helix transcriptional regulator n=1 Tax=Streptomyces sp. NPDC048508 TaxID=3365561 RepID=UPI00371C1E8D
MDSSEVFVERDAEVEALHDSVGALLEGRGAFVVVEGPAGIGKSRLLQEAAAAGRKAGGRVLTARGTEMERAFPMGLVQQLFESLVVGATPQQRERWLAGAAEQALTVIGLADRGTTEGSLVGDFAVLHGLYWLTANACQDQPLILIVDDAHWADAGSLRFLTHMLPRVKGLAVLIVVGVRPDEPGSEEELLDQITENPSSSVLHPKSLSAEGSAAVVRHKWGAEADSEFIKACHEATGGNPLLLESLAAVDGIEPVAENASLVVEVGAKAVTHRVKLRLAQIPREASDLAQAVAILGEGANLPAAAMLANIPLLTAAQMTGALCRIELLQTPRSDTESQNLRFVHPLVRSAVYDSIGWSDRTSGHSRAVDLLKDMNAPAVQIAAHLLQIPCKGDQSVVDLLRQAATEALKRGSSDSAFTYLARCLNEPPAKPVLAEVLLEAGSAALMIDLNASADFLNRALALTSNLRHRAQIASTLGTVLLFLTRTADAVTVFQEARDALPLEDDDMRRLLEADLLNVVQTTSGWNHIARHLPQLRHLPYADTLGARALDAMIAGRDTWEGDPAAIDHARSALTDGVLRQSNAPATVVGAWFGLLMSDRDQEAMDAIESSIDEARNAGSQTALSVGLMYRGLTWLWRGQLSEAESDIRDAVELIDETRIKISQPVAIAFLVQTLSEQGRIQEANLLLDDSGLSDPLPASGLLYWFLEAKAHLLRMQGDPEQSLTAALAAGERFAANAGKNPAVVSWRSEAALSLWALSRRSEALTYATEELDLARIWQAPRALGRALRVAGLITGGEAGLELLKEAVETLSPSPARLEYAKSLIDYGSALRRSGQRIEARELLTEGRALAEACGATPLSSQAALELTATGARPRRIQVIGPESLTPSERRIAELASEGKNNREIAQALFVTTKTVEAHLTNVYRKLQVSSRRNLNDAMHSSNSEDRVGEWLE